MPDAKCSLCGNRKLTTPAEQSMQACQTCADTIGLIPMPPSRRPRVPCARCNSRQFLRVIPREPATLDTAPMYVTHVPTRSRDAIWNTVHHLDIDESGVGLLETYICRKCGAVEWFCVDVDRIPVHPHLMTEAIDYAGDAPYR